MYSEPSQVSKMERLPKITNLWKPLPKCSISDAWLGSEYAYKKIRHDFNKTWTDSYSLVLFRLKNLELKLQTCFFFGC